MSRGGSPPETVGAVLARARENAGRKDVPRLPPEPCCPRNRWGDGEHELRCEHYRPPEPAPNSPEDVGFTNSQTRPLVESPLERFERLAAAFHAETGLLAPGKDYPVGAHPPPDREREDLWSEWLRHYRLAEAAAGKAPPANAEAPGSAPAPAGAQEALPGLGAPAAPAHDGPTCKSCSAPIYWAQVLEENEAGELVRVRNPDTKRFKAMPVDVATSPDGNVVLFRRAGEGIVCRVLRKGETPPPGARLRRSHFSSCPNAKSHRRPR